jgi:hypothetical protein
MTTATMATASDVARDFRHALRRLAATSKLERVRVEGS